MGLALGKALRQMLEEGERRVCLGSIWRCALGFFLGSGCLGMFYDWCFFLGLFPMLFEVFPLASGKSMQILPALFRHVLAA